MTDDTHSGLGPPAEISLRELRAAVDRSADGVAILDRAGQHLYANRSYAQLFGYDDPADLLGRSWEPLYPEDEKERLREAAERTWSAGTAWRGDVLGRTREGRPFSQDLTLTPLDDGRLLCVTRRLGDHDEAQERLERMAYYDPLTDLANRRLLEEKAEQALAMARRNQESVALLYLDLDGFKAINDTLGHAAGDRTLQVVARRLEDCVREADTAARVGGDEFAVLLGEVEGEAAAVLVAQRVLAALSEPVRVGDHSVDAGASIGIAFFPRYASSFEELMRQADLAMYGAGRSKEVGIRIFRPEQGIHTPRHARLVDELHDALQRYRFALHYQPVRELASDRLVGAQALVRWPHPRLGMLSAAKFVPLVEEAGLVRRLDRWVLASASLQLRTWSEAGFDGWMAVHLSRRSCTDPELADYLQRTLAATEGVSRDRLVLQIPAEHALSDPEGFGRLTEELQELGISVAVDAFEVNTASTSYLRRTPPRVLNLGPTLLTPGHNGDRRDRLVETVVELAHTVGTKVLAKGVERGTQREWLEELGCDFAQGYLVGWSVPPEEFLDTAGFVPEERRRGEGREGRQGRGDRSAGRKLRERTYVDREIGDVSADADGTDGDGSGGRHDDGGVRGAP